MLNELLIPEDLQESVAKFCKQSTSDDNKFVRAWGYSGIVSLAKQWDCYVPLAIEAITNGENDEAPSALKPSPQNTSDDPRETLAHSLNR